MSIFLSIAGGKSRSGPVGDHDQPAMPVFSLPDHPMRYADGGLDPGIRSKFQQAVKPLFTAQLSVQVILGLSLGDGTVQIEIQSWFPKLVRDDDFTGLDRG